MYSNEIKIGFNQLIKKVEFFPFEHYSNLVAVCFRDSIRFYNLLINDSQVNGSESQDMRFTSANDDIDFGSSSSNNTKQNSNFHMHLIYSIALTHRLDHFSFSPKTNLISSNINFVVCDNSKNLIFYNINVKNPKTQDSFKKEKIEAECVHKVSFDHGDGKLIALTADNFFFLWDYLEAKLKARFELQSPGISICWNIEEKSKVVVAEKSGLLRIYNIDTFKPMYTLLSSYNGRSFHGIISMDWCQYSPEIILALTEKEIYIWNTSVSCLPERLVDTKDNYKQVKIANFKENVIGYLEGVDSSSKLRLYNFRTNQIIYESSDFKLLKSFSLNSALPIVALACEQNLIISSIHVDGGKMTSAND